MKLGNPKLILPFVILAVGALGVAAQLATRKAPVSEPIEVLAPLVQIETAEPRPYEFAVRTQGTVVPRTESDLIPQVSGEIVWVSPAMVSGGFFEAGEPLVKLEGADFRSAVEASGAALARAESEAARAQKELERQKKLASQGVTSESRIDDAGNQQRVAAAALREAKARLADARRDLERTTIRAPYAGRVRTESVDVGQFLSRGTQVAQLYAVDWAEVRLPIPDRELRFLDLPLSYRPKGPDSPEDAPKGPKVELRAEFAGADHLWTGRIVRTEGEIDARSRMVTLVARVEDPYAADENDRPPLAVGLFVEATIRGLEIPDAFVLPRVALQGDHQLFVVGEEDRLSLRDVEILRLERDKIVVGEGLESGDRVCVTPLPGGIDGMEVRFAEPQGVERAAR